MKLSMLKAIPSYRDVLSVFGGYNHNLRIGEGEFYDMKNLSSAKYPVLSPRGKRGEFVFPSDILTPNISEMLVKGDDLYYVHSVVENDVKVDQLYKNKTVLFKFKKTYDKRTLVSMGNRIVVFPDKIVLENLEKTTVTQKSIDFSITAKPNSTAESIRVAFTPCKSDGSAEANGEASEFIKIEVQMQSGESYLAKPMFSDEIDYSVQISGVISEYTEGVTSSHTDWEEIEMLNGVHVVHARRSSYIIIRGTLSAEFTQNCKQYTQGNINTLSYITFARRAPEMDFVIESGNRLWGCKYGTVDGALVNEIYASKLGDPTNWQSFAGLASDSYAVTVGSDGAFTGAITYMGVPHFFKENCVHKIYGNFPSNFQVQDTACRGVQDGCSESLAIVNETLFYKSRTAVCAYDGSFPTEISSALGDKVYDNAAAGSLGNKYYISMRDTSSETNEYEMLVFDTAKGMWHKEDNTQATKFVTRRNNLYYLDCDSPYIKMVHSESKADTEMGAISWEAVTGIIGVDSPGTKYISGIEIRMKLDLESTVRIYIEYDSCGEWEQVYVKTGDKLSSTTVPLRPKRCDHLRLKIVGVGNAEIYSITKTITSGGN